MNRQVAKLHLQNTSRLLTLAAFAALLVASTFATGQNTITCASSTGCKKGFIAGFSTNGGAAKVQDSIIRQSAGAISVGGSLNAASAGSVNANTVFGSNAQAFGNSQGAGVFGQLSTTGESSTGSGWPYGGAGVWGDGGADSNYGVLGTTDDKAGGIFQNNGGDYYALFSHNNATGGTGFPWAANNGDGAGCSIDPEGDLSCTGAKNAVVAIDSGKHQVALAAIESPKNWFEDFGSGRLVGGVATVRLDSKFIQTVNTGLEYHVFLTPNGDCKGLYIHQKSATSFEVRELGGGNSSVSFDYRISALRKNYETVRFADHSREFPLSKDGRVRAAAAE